ncbi:hypothetical protein ACFPJ1_19445 [Kribbella qitaiheensis]|uniref:hypothetical protein n=1 Tax=Kribbella qitaiheensis TaxID=1544730 RepID=UPI00361B722F
MSHPGLGLPCSSLPSLDLAHPVDDLVVLRTIAGGEDLLNGLDVINRSPGRVACRVRGNLQQLHALRLFSGVTPTAFCLTRIRPRR